MNILVVDDSAFMRKIITDILEKMPDIHVCQQARNGQQALQIIEKLQPDLILLDVEMPVLNGLETLKKIKEQNTIPVVMLSALTNKETTIEALALGAADFVEKPHNITEIQNEWIKDFYWKIRSVSVQKPLVQESIEAFTLLTKKLPTKIKAIVVGASTGGPKAILNLVKALPDSLTMPIFIVQHMPKGFTASFAQRLNEETKVTVCEAENEMFIKNQVYLCPGDYHMEIKGHQIYLNQNEKIHGTRPAVDPLFLSAAASFKEELVAILLTGMGKDGTAGMKRIQETGGYTIAQDKETSVVFGMPRQAIQRGVIDEILSLEEICKKVAQIVRR
ncbi:MAG TPA: chemotaxis response regulator protein-glutamate methylesterase [Candidatus Tetragenococcus pullicola]|nr:chemotaxis response regulator protein-glutamate methylesterase [Candidatus Tetragenococcus pullicola]